MRSVKIIEQYVEGDVKPSPLLKKYLNFTKEDVVKQLSTSSSLHEVSCPGCGHAEVATSFDRLGMAYLECAHCHSLRISPRPAEAEIITYYRESKAEKYWRDELSQITKDARCKHILIPRLDWIIDSSQQYLPDAKHFVDMNANQMDFAELLENLERFEQKTHLNPNFGSETNNFQIHQGRLPDGSVDVVSLFEVLDRSADVDDLLERVYRMLKPGGLCFSTNILSSGFDIQVLWEKSENLFPPDRLNSFTVKGLQTAFDRHGFECLEFSTPGMFDLEIVLKEIDKDSSIEIPRFVSYLLENGKSEDFKRFQEFLQTSLMSSYGRVLVRKKSNHN